VRGVTLNKRLKCKEDDTLTAHRLGSLPWSLLNNLWNKWARSRNLYNPVIRYRCSRWAIGTCEPSLSTASKTLYAAALDRGKNNNDASSHHPTD
jgi:hypothetical protein